MKFGDDWTGVFLRGDDAVPYGMMLEQLLKDVESRPRTPEVMIPTIVLRSLVDRLLAANEFTGPKDERQTMLPFDEARQK